MQLKLCLEWLMSPGGVGGDLEEVLWEGCPPGQVSLVYRAYLQETAPEAESAEQACDSCLSQPRHSLHDRDTVASLRDMLPRTVATALPAESKRKLPLRIPGHTPVRSQLRSAVDWELSMCVICTVVGTGLWGSRISWCLVRSLEASRCSVRFPAGV